MWNMPGNWLVNQATCVYMLAGMTQPGGTTIPISRVRVIQASTTKTMVSQPACNNAGALVVGSSFIWFDNFPASPASHAVNGSRSDSFSLQVASTGALAPGTYTGTVFVSALVY
jgi:hypothetical protein